jgi:hypothetical protein
LYYPSNRVTIPCLIVDDQSRPTDHRDLYDADPTTTIQLYKSDPLFHRILTVSLCATAL